MAIKLHPSFAIHPGDFLRTEIVGPSALTVTELAACLKVTRQAMSALLNARAGLSADMALRFEHGFGVRADTLLRMQAAHDLAVARGRGPIDVERVQHAA